MRVVAGSGVGSVQENAAADGGASKLTVPTVGVDHATGGSDGQGVAGSGVGAVQDHGAADGGASKLTVPQTLSVAPAAGGSSEVLQAVYTYRSALNEIDPADIDGFLRAASGIEDLL